MKRRMRWALVTRKDGEVLSIHRSKGDVLVLAADHDLVRVAHYAPKGA